MPTRAKVKNATESMRVRNLRGLIPADYPEYERLRKATSARTRTDDKALSAKAARASGGNATSRLVASARIARNDSAGPRKYFRKAFEL